jgi:hypothetical protein
MEITSKNVPFNREVPIYFSSITGKKKEVSQVGEVKLIGYLGAALRVSVNPLVNLIAIYLY